MPVPRLLSYRSSPRGLLLATLIPILAGILQWMAWPELPPLTWLFFYPAVFFSAWVGGFYGGLLATALSTALAWYFFVPHPVSLLSAHYRQLLSIGIFVAMGVLFSLVHQRLIDSQAELRRRFDTPFRGHDGAVVGSIHDLTDAREAQLAPEDRPAHLAEPVAARTAERQANEAKARAIVDASSVPLAMAERATRLKSGRAAPRASMAAQPQRIPGVRVLVADDSSINREVARGVLEANGAIVYLADDGQEAVDWLQAHPDAVDIVLMDVQMPRLDGYAATRRIREDARWKDLPIVALTAGAFQTLRDAAQTSGMNGFIAKPFEVNRLMAAIQHWTGGRPESAATAPEVAAQPGEAPRGSCPPTSDDPIALSLPGIDLTDGVKQWGKIDAYRTYLNRFVVGYAGAGLAIARLRQQGDRVAASALTHKLIGVAATLAFPRVVGLARQLDTRLKEDRPIEALAAALQTAIDEVCAGIAGWSGGERPTTAARPSDTGAERAALGPLCERLLRALDRHDPGGAEAVLAQLQGLVAPALLAELQSRLTDFDFRGAEGVTQTLMHELNILVKA